MLRPLLIIGVGGAGGKTIRAMKQELNRMLESSGYAGGIPAAWQFLQIDTTRDGVDFPAPLLHQDEFHCVVPQGTDIYEITESIVKRGTASEQQRMLAGWGVAMPRIKINGTVPLGRATGRQRGVASLKGTLQAIQNSISKMQSPTAMAELAEVAHLMGAISPQNQPQAIIVSSLGGGSGSGMFMDVAELLKCATSAKWGHESISLLYTPEVFSSIRLAGNDISKNTLGAMNELIASQWVGISEESNLLYTKLGLATGNINEFGSRTNILIGAQNSSGFDIANGTYSEGMNGVFLNFGEALAGVVSNDDISDLFFYRVIPAIWGSKGVVDVSGLCPENFYNPTLLASGIGFGKITLGTEKIVDYVADKLTKHQVELLLWPEATPRPLEGGMTLSEVIQSKADEVWPSFLLDSGLEERESQNQIVDALLPEQAQELIRQFVNGIIKKNVGDTPRPFPTFTGAIWSEWESESSDFLASVKNEVNGNAQKWVPSIQEKLRGHISNELRLRGYAVLLVLTERLEAELRDHVMPDLLSNDKEFLNAAGGFNQQVFNKRVNEFADGLTGVSSQNDPFFQKLSQFLSHVLEFQINSYVNSIAAALVQDMLSFFIPPLKEQLNHSRFALREILKSDLMQDGSRNPFMSFPGWGSGVVPPQYKAKSLERTLIDPQDYESTYEFYAGNDAPGGEPTFQMSIGAALQGKKLNHSPGDHNLQSLVTVKSPWITSVREAQGSTGAAACESEWFFHTNISELSERNRRWLKNEDSTFGKFTNMSIREYVNAVNDPPQIRSKRIVKFVSEFEVLLRMAQPLITLNPKAMAHIVSVSDGGFAGRNLMKSNGIPFSASSEVGQGCIRVLQQNGFDSANHYVLQDWFHPESNTSTIFAFSALQNKLPAWAFASLTDPILKQVELSKNHVNTWAQFWDGRRTRPLAEAIPFESEMRRSMITGWFVATLFGMRKVRPLLAGRTVQIWNPTLETPGWSSFPSPLLATHYEDSRRESWVLPQLLMSAGIALAEFGKSGNPEFINSYRLLKYLGREVTTSWHNRDLWDANGIGDLLPTGERSQSNYLKNWVESGEFPKENGELLKALQASLALTPDRAEALIKTVELIRTEYNDIWNEMSSTAWHSLPETWELREDIDGALNDIARYVSELQNLSSPNID
jgi:hypothetical protein